MKWIAAVSGALGAYQLYSLTAFDARHKFEVKLSQREQVRLDRIKEQLPDNIQVFGINRSGAFSLGSQLLSTVQWMGIPRAYLSTPDDVRNVAINGQTIARHPQATIVANAISRTDEVASSLHQQTPPRVVERARTERCACYYI
eukprot:TRINITY_DN12065_c0_g1_i1.p2 TRINITY_DN12065_c0_g1~~TRINITY_DN12065_c0_g1_i1.p2  ORF type:complete len:144 (+),score=1.47 TRINITY_DN12065_c0_g1_i1:2428-2859(+)